MVINKIIFALIFVIGLPLSCQNVSAQTAKKKPKLVSKAEMEKREVKKFVASFIQILEETKDLDQVPESFFVSDFKIRFSKSYLGLDLVESTTLNKLDETEQYELHKTNFNMAYLSLTYAFSKISIEDSELAEDEDTDLENINNLFPPQIITLIKNSKTLNAFAFKAEDADYFKIKDIETFREFVADLKNLIYAQRMYLNDRSAEQKTNYEKNMKESRKSANHFSAEICMKNCEGFPEKTRIFEMRYYPLYFKIVRENGKYKIFDLTIGATD